ncbi:dTDP-4-dehydrorhamnose 3,5-epimerase [Zobellia galactanivorans]|uniref:dTDP-4-dehydrorhamnose 3,5-epimerase n=1 Tax=Zobellia galactanivorans (strain DSM 12802 / CCUG 47099 / CIP 106680 / NCIMB 13871 / Dsij) TaxID=63186 RepID=G0L4V6_ZOBGA|nr:dTDP-4-dehydrorhamnose 3,5-epimerase [Zobellia galactanivorans]CAZ95789.1 dTDP-4-dehydrorhamnose 3,5-epimerase [Zobellia galactanivorans]
MKITETSLKGCFIIQPRLFRDERGLFFESYQQKKFESAIGKEVQFVQDNISVSKKGVLRGLHLQTGLHAQAKLVQVAHGEVLDVVVDLRPESPTFGQHFKQILSSENRTSIFIPKGMAHGFLTLSEEATFMYKCDAFYNLASESGIIYNDEDLKIDWEGPVESPIISEKDKLLPTFKEFFQ